MTASGGIRGPIGLGYRVPCFVISPYSRGGLMVHDVFDHTSQLRLIETRFGVPVPNLTDWRRSVTKDMTSTFNFAVPPNLAPPNLNQPRRVLSTLAQCGFGVFLVGGYIRAKPSLPGALPPDNARPGTHAQQGGFQAVSASRVGWGDTPVEERS